MHTHSYWMSMSQREPGREHHSEPFTTKLTRKTGRMICFSTRHSNRSRVLPMRLSVLPPLLRPLLVPPVLPLCVRKRDSKQEAWHEDGE
jgi:hypothetical protein